MKFDVTGKRVTVAGAARSGIAAAELLARRGAQVTLSETRHEVPEAGVLLPLGVRLELGGHETETFTEADLVVLSPGVPPETAVVQAARDRGVPVIAEIELAYRWLQGRVIAITGTKGKSTTTALTGRMLEAAGFKVTVGGNIGAPLSAQVSESTPDTFHVVEASSFQLEASDTFHPWIAAALNFSADHLDQHSSVEAYASAKRRIFRNQDGSDWAVVNAEDPGAQALAAGAKARRVNYGLALRGDGFSVDAGVIVERRGQAVTPLVPVDAVHVPGRHILSDVVAATAISRTAGATPAAMTRAVAGFNGLEHAMEMAGEIDGVRFINDSKATNIESARRSIESVDAGLVAIIGGRYKGGDFGELASPLRERQAIVVAIGEAAPLVEQALESQVRVERAGSMADAVRAAFRVSQRGGTVVLAPACSSFDMFRDYAERGRQFKEEVRRLAVERRAGREQ